MEQLLTDFLRYVSVDTQSRPGADTFPSTEGQKDLSRLLTEELRGLGVEAEMDQYGYVYASIPGNLPGKRPAMGFLAHVDTAPDCSGRNVKPRVIRDYDGEDIVLNRELGIVMRVSEFPHLAQYKGQTLVVTDGTTLLGADDKAGVAELMYLARTLMANPGLPHGPVKLGFTVDEEIGRGPERFDIPRFGADFAYTVDGGGLGELSYETFNAASAVLRVKGVSIHTGLGKGRMKNASRLAMEFHSLLPAFADPACTEGREGFYHLASIRGDVEECVAEYGIRDFDKGEFEGKKEHFRRAAEFLNQKYGDPLFEVSIQDSYLNMADRIRPAMYLMDYAWKAMERVGASPRYVAERGGTDGCQLTRRGLLCPNLCKGGHNNHGRYEYIPVESMEKVARALVEMVVLAGEDPRWA